MPGTERAAASRWPVPAAVLAVTGVVLGPLLVGGGIALRGDMVFVPDQPWKPAWLGLDGSVPRAVPMDALVALADEVVPGALLQRLLLAGALLAGGFGIARLARGFGTAGQVAAVLVFLWNPWVHGRLEIGQWPTVLGYGLLPWLVLAARRTRDGTPGGLPATALLLVGAAVCAPSVGVLGLAVALAVVAVGRDYRPLVATAALGALANLPWVVPALIGGSIHGNDTGFAAFAARGETPMGTFASLLSMGGIWKTSVTAPERTHTVVVAAAAVLALVLLAAFRYVVPVLGRPTTLALGWLGAGTFAVAFLPSLGPVARALDAIAADVPAIALLRDSQRFLAPFGLVLALGAAALVHRLLAGSASEADADSDRSSAIALAGVVALAPVLLLPSMLWGLGGDLSGADYPEEWAQVADVLGDAPGYDGAVVVLPWRGSYRGFAWNDDRAVLDPAPRFLPAEVLVDDRVFLRGRVVPGEDPYLGEVGRALEAADPARALGALGVRWVLVEKGNGAAEPPPGTVAHDGPGLRLVDLGATGNSVENPRHEPAGWSVSLANAITASVVVISIWFLTRRLWG